MNEIQRKREVRKLRALLKREGGRIADLYSRTHASPEVEKFRRELREERKMTPEKLDRVAI